MTEKEIQMQAEEGLATDICIRKVEMMHTLIARNQAKVREFIIREEQKAEPDASKIKMLRSEISNLFKRRERFHRDEIDQTLADLKTYSFGDQ